MDTEQNNGSDAAELQEQDQPVNGADVEPAEAEEAAADPEPGAVAIELAAKTLSGDLRDFVIELLRDLRSPWHKLPESQQSFQAQRVQDRCAEMVGEAVNLIAAREFPAIDVLLEEIRFKEKGCDVKLGVSGMSRELRHALVDSRGGRVMVVIADPLFFRGARGPAKIDKQALFDATPNGHDEPAGAAGPLFAEGAAEPIGEARNHGYNDGFDGVQDHAARWAAGVAGHADYELGKAEGEDERAAKLAEAREVGATAGEAGADRLDNPHPAGTAEHDMWLAGWIAADPEPGAATAEPPQPKRRGRPRKDAAGQAAGA